MRQVVSDGEQAGKQSGMMAGDLLDQPGIAPHDHEAERRLELTQAGLDEASVKMGVAACGTGLATTKARALDNRQRREHQRPSQQQNQSCDQRKRYREQDEGDEHRRHAVDRM